MTAPKLHTKEYQKVVVGVDLGSVAGYAVLDAFDGSLVSVHQSIRKTCSASRIGSLRANLDTLLRRHDVQLVCVEVPMGAHKNALMPLCEMLGVLKFLCHWIWKMPWAEVHLAKVKKLATGKGNAKKHDMIAAAQEKWGGDYTDNESDALFIAEWGRINILDKINKTEKDL